MTRPLACVPKREMKIFIIANAASIEIAFSPLGTYMRATLQTTTELDCSCVILFAILEYSFSKSNILSGLDLYYSNAIHYTRPSPIACFSSFNKNSKICAIFIPNLMFIRTKIDYYIYK